MKLFDAHTHLNDEPFWDQEGYYVDHAKSLDVVKMACVGQDLKMNQRAIELSQEFDNVYAIVGFSPDEAKNYDAKKEADLVKQLKMPKTVALGEIGLDYYWDESPRDVQRKIFAHQIELAHSLKMPVNIHTRDAFEDCYEILKNSNLEYGAILHSFNGDSYWLKKFLALGVYISYSGVVSFTKATDVHESAKLTPIERLLVETDAPYLTPKPYRGRQNEPGYVRYVAQAIAELKGISLDEVAANTYENTMRVYGIK